MNQTIKISILAILIAFTFQACEDKVTDPPNPNEEELITTVELTFTAASNSSDVRVFRFADPDGEGGNAPTRADTIRLESNTDYVLAVRFLDQSKSPEVDITNEIKNEANEHLVCYSTAAGTSVIITDKDANGLALGLEAEVKTTSVAKSTIGISLKHQPNVKTGSCELGETDVEVSFVLEVE
jgi:hypothetical protein